MIDENKLIMHLADLQLSSAPDERDSEEVQEECRKAWQDLEEVINIIKEQPKVGEWIPCSSGQLPKLFKRVLLQLRNGISVVGCRSTKMLSEEIGWQTRDEEFKDGDVVAYMPLPEPYREDGAE